MAHFFTICISFLGLSAYALASPDLVSINEKPEFYVGHYEIRSSPNAPDIVSTSVDFAMVESGQQLKAMVTYASNEIASAKTDNSDVAVEFVYAKSAKVDTPSIAPLNSFTAGIIAEQAPAMAGIEVSTGVVGGNEITQIKELFEPVLAIPEIKASSVQVPRVETVQPGVEVTETPILQKPKAGILTITRVLFSSGAIAITIYFNVSPETALAAVAPALAFYPITDYLFQTFAERYAGYVKGAKSVAGRIGRRFIVAFPILLTHGALLASANLAPFELMSILGSAVLSTVASHPWWEMVVKGKPTRLTGAKVSFALGLTGAVGIILKSFDIAVGSYLLYGMGISGAIVWIANGGMETIVNDAKKFYASVRKGLKVTTQQFTDPCSALRRRMTVIGRFFRISHQKELGLIRRLAWQ